MLNTDRQKQSCLLLSSRNDIVEEANQRKGKELKATNQSMHFAHTIQVSCSLGVQEISNLYIFFGVSRTHQLIPHDGVGKMEQKIFEDL